MLGYIYKITNLINGKVYIGLTTKTVEERWKQHKALVENGNTRHLYSSMRKYGIENFKIETIDSANTVTELGELEKKYIKEYNSKDYNIGYNLTNGGETANGISNPKARLTEDDVYEIRNLYGECRLGTHDAWELYKDKISYSAFEKVWEGITWLHINREVYTDKNLKWHKTHSKVYLGETNCNAKFLDEEVIEIRRYYVTHTLNECYEKYGVGRITRESFRGVIDGTYQHIPCYRKKEGRWVNPSDKATIKKRSVREQEIFMKGELAYITIYNDFGENPQTFFTNKKYYNVLVSHRWNIIREHLRTVIDGKSISFKLLIMGIGNNKRTYHIDGNRFNCCIENLTTNQLEVKKD